MIVFKKCQCTTVAYKWILSGCYYWCWSSLERYRELYQKICVFYEFHKTGLRVIVNTLTWLTQLTRSCVWFDVFFSYMLLTRLGVCIVTLTFIIAASVCFCTCCKVGSRLEAVLCFKVIFYSSGCICRRAIGEKSPHLLWDVTQANDIICDWDLTPVLQSHANHII